ncbi:iron permease FTR1 family-domain-containing protein [Chytriomyces sp. MP71]|nr:iron permease FTR1 family-domain-containing protein [Chytriomyces sp. MP71]
MVGFSVPVFFVLFREATEASIVVSVLITFISKQFSNDLEMKKVLMRNLWLGTGVGLGLSLAIAAVFLVMWFKYASDLWASTEALWEAIMSLIAGVLMTVMSLAFVKSQDLTAKWTRKLGKAIAEHDATAAIQAEEANSYFATDESEPRVSTATEITLATPAGASQRVSIEGTNKPTDFIISDTSSTSRKSAYSSFKKARGGAQAFFWIPFITVLREGLEGMVFLGGIGINESPGNIPIAAVAGIAAGLAIGYVIYRAGTSAKLQTFFVGATVFLLYLSAGLMSKAVGKFEQNTWNHNLGTMDSDMSAFYNVKTNVFHLNCCNPEDKTQGGYQLFNALLGWNNTASIGTVSMYVIYWLSFSGLLIVMKLSERRRIRLGLEKKGFKHMIKQTFFGARA